MLELVTVLPCPYALPEYFRVLDDLKEFRREQDVVDLLWLRGTAECAGVPVVLEVEVLEDVTQGRPFSEQGLERVGIRRVVEVTDDRDPRDVETGTEAPRRLGPWKTFPVLSTQDSAPAAFAEIALELCGMLLVPRPRADNNSTFSKPALILGGPTSNRLPERSFAGDRVTRVSNMPPIRRFEAMRESSEIVRSPAVPQDKGHGD
jgi:hypothetical protein